MRFAIRARYVEWLAKYRWRLICVFTLRRGRSAKTAKRLLRQWFEEMQRREGRLLSWIVRSERGPTGQLHFHVLIAGIASRVYPHAKRWEQLAGHVHIVRFRRLKYGRSGDECWTDDRGVDYVLKGVRDDDYDIDGELRDQHLLPRFRRPAAVTGAKCTGTAGRGDHTVEGGGRQSGRQGGPSARGRRRGVRGSAR